MWEKIDVDTKNRISGFGLKDRLGNEHIEDDTHVQKKLSLSFRKYRTTNKNNNSFSTNELITKLKYYFNRNLPDVPKIYSLKIF